MCFSDAHKALTAGQGAGIILGAQLCSTVQAMTGMKFNGVQSDVEEFALALLVRTISTLDEQQPAQAPTCAPRNAPDCKRRQKSKLTVELLSIGCLSQDGLAVECSQGGNKGLVTTLETKRPGLKLFAMKTVT